MYNQQCSQHNKKNKSLSGHILSQPRILASVTALLYFNETYIDVLVGALVRLFIGNAKKICEYTFFLFVLVSSHSYASSKSQINSLVH